MGFSDLIKLAKAGRRVSKARDQVRKDEAMNYDWTKSVKAGILQILTLIQAAVFAAVLDALYAVFSNTSMLKATLAKADVGDAYAAVILMACAGIARVIQNWMKHSPTAQSLRVTPPLVVLALLLPCAAQAQTERKSGPLVYAETGVVSTLTRGEKDERAEVRATIAIPIHAGGCALRGRISGAQDGGTLDTKDPSTYRSVSLASACHYPVARGVSIAAFGAADWSIEGAAGAPADGQVFTVGGGVFVPLSEEGWVLVGAGRRGAVGGRALMLSASLPKGDRTRWVIEGALPLRQNVLRQKAWEVTTGLVFAVWSNR